MNKILRVAAYQGPAIKKAPLQSLEKVLEVVNEANKNNVDILCMPESYLHGYLKSLEEVEDYSLSLDSTEFRRLCHE